MAEAKLMLAGEEKAAKSLQTALGEAGFEAELSAASGVKDALAGIEHDLERHRFHAAISVGTGEEALALAVTAAKQGVPLAAFGAGSGEGGDEMRIITTLAGADLGSDTSRAADLIRGWLAGHGSDET